MAEEEQPQQVLQEKILSDQEPGNAEGQENPPAEEPQEVKKEYKPANPTIKECILLNQLLPISQIDKNIDAISTVIYENDDLLNEFLQKVDNRTTVSQEDPKGDFIKCEQNRDGDSYRSPISNQYFPPTDDGKYPSPKLRDLEEKLNKMFHQYAKSYYSLSANVSCYCWDLGAKIEEGFGVAIVIKNALSNKSTWDSSNVITVTFDNSSGKIKAKYNLITTVNLSLLVERPVSGKVNLSGSIARSAHSVKEVKDYVEDSHIQNIGVLVEDLENSLRSTINTIYVMKSKEIIDTARYNPTLGKPGIEQAQALKNAFMGAHK